MAIEVNECPHCRTRVAVAVDGVCPACRKNIQGRTAPNPAEDIAGTSETETAASDHARPLTSTTAPAGPAEPFGRTLAAITPIVWVTPAIVAVNALVFAAMVAKGVHYLAPDAQKLLEWGANYGPKTMSGQWWRLATCMFLHIGAVHLAVNMWVLWDLGRLVERLVGNVGFLAMYFVSGLAGSIASLAWNPLNVSAGASGAVFGVAGALLGFLSLRSDTIPAAVLKPLRNSIVGFLILNIALGVMLASRIDLAAHAGGFAAGIVCGLILSQPLSAEMRARRSLRSAAVVLLGAIALPLAAIALPEPPPDVQAEMQKLGEMERRVLAAHNDLVLRSRRGEVSDAEFADAVARDFLPPWIELRQRFERALDVPHVKRDVLARVIEYMRAREEGWQLQVEGLREQDASKMQRANQRSKEADELAKQPLQQ